TPGHLEYGALRPKRIIRVSSWHAQAQLRPHAFQFFVTSCVFHPCLTTGTDTRSWGRYPSLHPILRPWPAAQRPHRRRPAAAIPLWRQRQWPGQRCPRPWTNSQSSPLRQWVREYLQASQTPVLPSRFQRSDRKSTRLNSSHVKISYAVFCLKKKNIFLLMLNMFYQTRHEGRRL